MNAHQLLTQTRELLSDPARWTKGAFGQTASGDATNALDPQAVCWCLMGATVKAARAAPSHPAVREARAAIAPTASIIEFNDAKTTTHQDVLDALDQAIERTKPS